MLKTNRKFVYHFLAFELSGLVIAGIVLILNRYGLIPAANIYPDKDVNINDATQIQKKLAQLI